MRLLKINKGDGTSKTINANFVAGVLIKDANEIEIVYHTASTNLDRLAITYTNTNQTSPMQMREFFSNAIIRSASGNNTSPILEVTSPLPITLFAIS
jgi:hypothetical protein